MVNYSAAQLDTVFSALGDPTRRAILAQLAQGPSSVTELETPKKMSLPGLTKHLDVLVRAGLVKRKKRGRVVCCRLEPKPLQNAALWITDYQRFWEQQFDSLADYLDTSID